MKIFIEKKVVKRKNSFFLKTTCNILFNLLKEMIYKKVISTL